MLEKTLSRVPCKRINVPARTVLLESGTVAQNVYFIRSGCTRLWFNNEGEDVTLQFFLEGQVVASFDSLLHDRPSEFTLETILPTEIDVYDKRQIEEALRGNAELGQQLTMQAFKLASKYMNLFLSRIKDTPQKRYERLLEERPDIVAKIPQHYIASYLGITAVSLSRIRARIGKS